MTTSQTHLDTKPPCESAWQVIPLPAEFVAMLLSDGVEAVEEGAEADFPAVRAAVEAVIRLLWTRVKHSSRVNKISFCIVE